MQEQNHPLAVVLREHFSLNLSRIKCLSLVIKAMLQCRTVNLSILSQYISGTCQATSSYRRLQRLIHEINLPSAGLAKVLVCISGLWEEKQWVLCLDRTNWMFGKKHINILYLGVSFKGVAIPLFGNFYRVRSVGTLRQASD
jgi:hypothetical protein